MKTNPYTVQVHKALLSFQMIEEALKICIGMSYEIIGKTAPAPVIFHFDRDKILNAPLSRLIKMFSEVNGNAELVSDLGKVTKWRNFCAHSAFAHDLMNRASKSRFTPHSAEDVAKIADFSANLVLRLGSEIITIRKTHHAIVGKDHELSAIQAPSSSINMEAQ